MPTYTYECPICGDTKDVQLTVSEYLSHEQRCAKCPAEAFQEMPKMHRLFKVPQVAQDSYRAPRCVSSLNSLDNDPGKVPTFESRSEEKRYIKEHNRVFGTKYDY